MIEASLMYGNSDEDKVAFKSTFPPRPLKKENKEGFCLNVTQEVLAGVWEYIEERDMYSINFNVKILKLG